MISTTEAINITSAEGSHQQRIDEFLTSAENITSSSRNEYEETRNTARLSPNRASPIENTVQFNDSSRYNRERTASTKALCLHPHNPDTQHQNEPLSHDGSHYYLYSSALGKYDERLVREIIAHDEQLNQEVDELFGTDMEDDDEVEGDDFNWMSDCFAE